MNLGSRSVTPARRLRREPTAKDGTVIAADGVRDPGTIMASCDEFHKAYDRIANGEIQAGKLPPYMHIEGRVAWYVAQGPYSKLGDMWREFMGKVRASKIPVQGPPGDLYVCDPAEHKGPSETTLSTIMWAPLKKLPGEVR